MNIKTRLTAYFVIASVIAIAIPSSLAISYILQNTEKEFEQAAEEKLELGSQLINGFFNSLFEDATYFAHLPSLKKLRTQSLSGIQT